MNYGWTNFIILDIESKGNGFGIVQRSSRDPLEDPMVV